MMQEYIALLEDAVALGRSVMAQAMDQGKFELALDVYNTVKAQEWQLSILNK